MNAAGGVILPLVAQIAITGWGWRPAWGVMSCIMICLGLIPVLLFEAYLSGILGGFSEGAQSTVIVLLLVSYFGRTNIGGIYGTNRALTVFGFSVGPIIAGLTYDFAGSYILVFWGFLIMLIIATSLVTSIKEVDRSEFT